MLGRVGVCVCICEQISASALVIAGSKVILRLSGAQNRNRRDCSFHMDMYVVHETSFSSTGTLRNIEVTRSNCESVKVCIRGMLSGSGIWCWLD